jgi:hypothetical protein
MSTYNTLQTEMSCLRCALLVRVEINLYFGDTSMMDEFKIGDRYKWRGQRAVHNGGRPEGGNIDGEGYTECSHCGKDFFVKVIVRNDIIVKVEPDIERKGYVPD